MQADMLPSKLHQPFQHAKVKLKCSEFAKKWWVNTLKFPSAVLQLIFQLIQNHKWSDI